MTLDGLLNIFRAIGEETRLRIVALLLRGELTVTEITMILGQSQPRVSRHLKILTDAGVVEKFREGSWMFYRIAAPDGAAAILEAARALNSSTDRLIARDGDRFAQSRTARADAANAYFEANAAEWDRVRALHIDEATIEARMRAMLGREKVEVFIDVGTGTGRMLALFASAYERGLGFDLSREMLTLARANLDRAGVAHAQVRHGDLFSLPLESGSADAVCLHQVLHFLAEPALAVREAARLLRPGGVLLMSDFAPHQLEFLRDEHAHRRLGFPDEEVAGWCEDAGLALEASDTLAPAGGKKGELTVKIWLARAPRAVARLRKRSV